MARGSSGESVFGRVSRVLECFNLDNPVLTPAQIARRAQLPAATAYRIVNDLVSRGWLEREPTGGVHVGVRLWEIASRAPRALGLREAAMPFMEDLHAVIRHHTQLGVLEGREVLFIERLSTRRAVINVTLIGGRLPLHASSSGLVLLAHADQTLQDEVLGATLPQLTRSTPTEPTQLRSILAGVRQQGYVVCNGYIHPDARGVAVPIRDPHGAVIASLGVVVPTGDDAAMAQVAALTTASRGITRMLGAQARAGN